MRSGVTKRSIKTKSFATKRFLVPKFVISSYINLSFINHTTKIQVNIAPSGISTFAVTLSNRSEKSMPKSELNVSALSNMETTVVVVAAALRDILNSSEK